MLKFASGNNKSLPPSLELHLLTNSKRFSRMKMSRLPNFILKAVLPTLLLIAVGSAHAGKNQSNYSDYNACLSNSGSQSDCDSALGESVYNLVSEDVYVSTSSQYSNISIDDVNISISAWSDTVGTYNDDVVTSAYVVDLGSYGYGVYNKDAEMDGSSPDHAIDSYNTVSRNVDYDFDFVLLSFSESVTLTGAGFSWVGKTDNTQLSIAALDDLSGLVSGDQTWSNIVEGALTAGSYDIESYESIDIAQFEETETAQYWLVGAYNSVFGELDSNMFDDAFKLASIGFEKASDMPENSNPTEVSEPNTLGAFLAVGLIVAWRRKNK